MQSSSTSTPKVIGALAVAAVIGIGGFLFFNGTSQKQVAATSSSSSSNTSQVATTTTPTATATTPAATTTATATPTASTSSGYKDGTYNATSNYDVPDGTNSLAVTLTIRGGTITDVKTTSNVSGRQSQRYVDSFNSSISSAVVGTPLASASQSRVGGASLTTSAFDDALQTITNNAKA